MKLLTTIALLALLGCSSPVAPVQTDDLVVHRPPPPSTPEDAK